MYDIGNVIVGTHLPWTQEDYAKIAMAYVVDDPCSLLDEGESVDDLMASAEQGELDWLDLFGERDDWNQEYHGASDSPVAWVGIKVGQFDVTDHFSYKRIIEMIVAAKAGTVVAEASKKYMALPKAVRDLLPPLDVYIVWSSS
jgi:hypothetical protein